MPTEGHTQQTSSSPAESGVRYMEPQGAQQEGATPAGKPGAVPGASPVQESTGPTQEQQPDPATIATFETLLSTINFLKLIFLFFLSNF